MQKIKTIGQLKQFFLKANLKIRTPQLKMILLVKEALLKGEKIVIEAPTATGKSFAYLVGALLANNERKEKLTIVISTATVALQEQLYFKDLPFLAKLIDDEIDYKLAKGRGRYLCLRKFNFTEKDSKNFELEVDKLESELATGWSGDIDELNHQPEPSNWQKLTSTSTNCSGKRCEFYQECPFYLSRKNLRKADIVIVNHSLLLAHLALGDGAILPEFEQSVMIIDECHHLPKKALSAFSAQATLIGSQSWINDLDKLLNNIPSKAIKPLQRDKISKAKKPLIEYLTDAQSILHIHYQKNHKQTQFQFVYRDQFLRIKEINEELHAIANQIRLNAEIILNTLKEVHKSLDEFADNSTKHTHQTLDRTFSQLSFMLERCDNLYNLWNLILDQTTPPIAKWFEPYQKDKDAMSNLDIATDELFSSHLQDYMIFASPIEAGYLLDQFFWSQMTNGVVLCSATVRALGSFNRFLESTGLDHSTKAIALPSPLNYQNSQLIIPKMKVTPQQASEHITEASNLLKQYLNQNKKGSLVLFTSQTAMRQTYDLLPKTIQSITIKQGDYAKHEIISRHKKQINNQKASIIFGLDSFSEGLDLPGEFLELLIIHKLPFSVPNDPIEKTRADWLTSIGKNSFVEISLPEASLKLAQMCGRLIRREEDQGKIFILDTRLQSKFYAKQMLDNLPSFNL